MTKISNQSGSLTRIAPLYEIWAVHGGWIQRPPSHPPTPTHSPPHTTRPPHDFPSSLSQIHTPPPPSPSPRLPVDPKPRRRSCGSESHGSGPHGSISLTPSAPRTHARHPQPSSSGCDLDRPCSPPPASTSPEIEASPPSNHGFLARWRARHSINLAGSGARVACLGSPATRTGQRHWLPLLQRLRPATGSGRLSQVIDEIHLPPAFILGSFSLAASDLFVICTR